jgi:hypothetical protein
MEDYPERLRAPDPIASRRDSIASRRALIVLGTFHVVLIAASIAGLLISLDSRNDESGATGAYGYGVLFGLIGIGFLARAANRRAETLFRARQITALLRQIAQARVVEIEHGWPFDEKGRMLLEAQELRDRLLKAGDLEEAEALTDSVIEFHKSLRPNT